jgi:hypothetical protein
MKTIDFPKVQQAFNRIRPLSGQLVGMATCDPNGIPNIAPVGSMRVVDEETVHVLQGGLPRTMANLQTNPNVAFSVWLKPTLPGIMKSLNGKDEVCMGYRVYGTLTGSETDRSIVLQECQHILKRVPWFARKPMAKFFSENLKTLLRFSIREIRVVE